MKYILLISLLLLIQGCDTLFERDPVVGETWCRTRCDDPFEDLKWAQCGASVKIIGVKNKYVNMELEGSSGKFTSSHTKEYLHLAYDRCSENKTDKINLQPQRYKKHKQWTRRFVITALSLDE